MLKWLTVLFPSVLFIGLIGPTWIEHGPPPLGLGVVLLIVWGFATLVAYSFVKEFD